MIPPLLLAALGFWSQQKESNTCFPRGSETDSCLTQGREVGPLDMIERQRVAGSTRIHQEIYGTGDSNQRVTRQGLQKGRETLVTLWRGDIYPLAALRVCRKPQMMAMKMKSPGHLHEDSASSWAASFREPRKTQCYWLL